MFGFVLLVIGLLLGLGLVAKRRLNTGAGRSARLVPLWIPGMALTGLCVVLIAFSCVKTVGAREVGIPVTFGSIGPDLQPGLHILAPWTVVHSCSLGQQQSIQSQDPTTGDKTGTDGIPINGSDQGAATADVAVLYHFDSQHAGTIYRKYACDAALVKENLIRQPIRGAVAQAAAALLSTDLKSHRAEIATSAQTVLANSFKDQGVIVDNIVVSDIKLSDPVQKAADAKLQAQQAAQQAQFTLQQAQVDKQTQQVRAEAQKAANDSQNASLTPAILCQEWINAIATAKPQVINTGGPCGGVVAGGGTIIALK